MPVYNWTALRSCRCRCPIAGAFFSDPRNLEKITRGDESIAPALWRDSQPAFHSPQLERIFDYRRAHLPSGPLQPTA
jgi:hypothetical protein